MHVATGEQKMEITQVLMWFSKFKSGANSNVHDKCSRYSLINKTVEYSDRLKDLAPKNRKPLLMKLLNVGNFIWVISKHTERQMNRKTEFRGLVSIPEHYTGSYWFVCVCVSVGEGTNWLSFQMLPVDQV